MSHTHPARSIWRSTTLVLGVALLGACAAAPETAPAPPAPVAAAPAPAPAVVQAPQPDPRAQFKQLSEALQASDVVTTETPDGRVKLSIPSDLSFGLNSATVNPEFAKVLDTIAESLVRFPETSAEIVGHTDTSGRAASNKALSLKRAESTRDHLVSRSVSVDRLKVTGMGQDMPVADNRTREGRSANRRVDIFVGKP